MLFVLFQTLALAASGLLSFGSMTLVILLLLSERGWRNGLSYALGYFSAYALIGSAAVSLGYRPTAPGASEPGAWPALLLMALGGLLLWLAVRNARQPAPETIQPPRFFKIVDRITPLRAFGFGALVTVLNVKNLGLFLTALSVVLLSPLSLAEKVSVALLAALVFCLSVFIPVVIYLAFPQRARTLLNGLKTWLEGHSRPIGIWAPLLFGLIFFLRGITELL